MSTLEIVIEARNRANAALVQLDGLISKLDSSSESLSTKFGNVSKSVGLVGAAFTASLTVPITAGATAVIMAAAKLEQYQVAFSTMLGSASKATAFIKDLQDFSAKTPFELPEIIAAGRQLLAYGFSAEQVKGTLETLGDIASGTGTRIEDLTYLYGTLAVQGRVYARDLLQFTNRGIPALDALAASMGKSKAEIMQMVSDGKIGFADVQTAFEKLTAEGGKFHGMMEAQSQTLLGLWSTFKDNFFIMMSQIGLQLAETFDLRGKLKVGLEYLEYFRTKLLELIKTNPQLVEMGVIFLGVAASIGPLLIGLSALISATGFVVKGIELLAVGIGYLFTPIGLTIVAISALAYAFYTDFGGIRTYTMNVVNELIPIINNLKDTVVTFFNENVASSSWFKQIPELTGYATDALNFLMQKFNELGGIQGILSTLQQVSIQAWAQISAVAYMAYQIISGIVLGYVNYFQGILMPLWETVKAKSSELWTNIVAQVTSAWTSLNAAFLSISTWIGVMLPIALSFLSNLWSERWAIIEQVTSTVTTKVVELWTTISTSATQAYQTIEPIITEYANLFQEKLIVAWEYLKTTSSSVWASIQTNIIVAWAIIQTAANSIYLWLYTSIPSAMTYLKNAWTTMWTEMPQNIENAKTQMDAIWLAIQNSWASLVQYFETSKMTIISVWENIKAAWNTFYELIRPTVENIKRDFMTFVDSLGGVKDAFFNMVAGVTPLLGVLSVILGVVLVAAIDIFSAAVANLGPFVEGIFNAIGEWARGLATNFWLMVTLVKQMINGDWKGTWETAKAIFWNSYNTMIATANALWMSIVAVFNFIFMSVTNILRSMGVDVDSIMTSLKNAWKNSWDSVKSTYETVHNALVDNWKTINGWLAVTLPFAMAGLVTMAQSYWSSIKNAVINALNPVVSTFQTVVNYCNNTIQSAMNGLKNFLSGLSFPNPFGGLLGALSSIMSNIQWIIDHLPLIGSSSSSSSGGSGHALGTNASPGGWKMVGENGPELMYLPIGTKVLNNRETRQIGNPDGKAVNIYATVNTPIDLEVLAYQIADIMQTRGI